MPTVAEISPSSTTSSNGVDCEPDDAWKENLRGRIEEGLQSMVADAKENHATELSKAPDTTEARIHLEADYRAALLTIKSLASEQYTLELDRERNQRRWTAAVPLTPGWSQYFRQEQQNIMNCIKQSNQTDNSFRTASESPTEERCSVLPKPSNEPPPLAPTTTTPVLPEPASPSARPAVECEISFVSPQSVRRGTDVRSYLSASVHARPSLPENWVFSETVDEPEEPSRSSSPRARLPSIDRPPQPSVSPDIRWDSSMGRSSGSMHSAEPRSAPRAPPEVWKPAISPAEDSLPHAKPYNIGRPGSVTSMRPTGSGATIQPSIIETIPKPAGDDGSLSDESDIEGNDYERVQETIEQVRPWTRISTTTNTDKGVLRCDDVVSSGLISDDRHRPIDIPVKPPPYYESSPRDSYAHRQDPRPIPARLSYGGDDGDYGPQYSTPYRPPHGPRPPTYLPQRESSPTSRSRPISRQVSFTRRQLYLDFDDERDIIIDREGRDRNRERHWDRDKDRDGGGRDIHSTAAAADPRRSTTPSYPYSAQRHSSYPNPSTTPGGSSKPALQDYDVHDEWEGGPGPRYNNRYRGPLPNPHLDNLEYRRRPESARPGRGLSLQSSCVIPQRDDPDRRYSSDNGS